jgi:single-strand DNA-binding protein
VKELTMNDEPMVLNNLAVLRGTVSTDPQHRELAGPRHVAQFDVTTRLNADGRDVNVSVPVAWPDPSDAAVGAIVSGVDVVIVGTVRRRFFRVGGATQSRTEVVADAVLPARRRKRVAIELQRAADRLLAG